MEGKSLHYGINNIKKIASYLNTPEVLGIKDINEESIRIGKGFQFSFDKDTGIFIIKAVLDFVCRIDTPEPLKLFGAKIQYDFLFKDFEDIVKERENSKIDLPDDLVITLMSVSYSTSRGILSMLSFGTEYQNIILPLVDIQEFKKMIHPDAEIK